jgi:hypothetical protein
MSKKTGKLIFNVKEEEEVHIDGPCTFKILKLKTNKAVFLFTADDETTVAVGDTLKSKRKERQGNDDG